MENIGFGLTLTVIGMGLVFALLALLWFLLSIIARIDARSPEEEPAATMPAVRVSGEHDFDDETLAAILVAVVAHAAVRRQQGAPAMRVAWPGSQLYASRWLAAGRTRQTRGWIPPRK